MNQYNLLLLQPLFIGSWIDIFAYSNGVSQSAIADMTFDGNGNITVENISSTPDGANQTGTNSGTYSVAADGSFSFHLGEYELLGQLSENADSYIGARVDDNNTQLIIVGVKK